MTIYSMCTAGRFLSKSPLLLLLFPRVVQVYPVRRSHCSPDGHGLGKHDGSIKAPPAMDHVVVAIRLSECIKLVQFNAKHSLRVP